MTSDAQPQQSGTLYVVAVPIGHPDDVTVRALQVLEKVDVIASEDPKATQRFLTHHAIQTTVTSYGPSNLKEKVGVLLQRLQGGMDIALVSDCGSPIIADPGHLLVAAAHAHRIPVVPVPGPSVIVAALTIAGFPCDAFHFLGHLPRTPSRIRPWLTDSLKRKVPTVAFGTVASVAHALATLSAIAPRHLVIVACDLTTPDELIIRGTARQVHRELRRISGRDITLVLAGIGGRKPNDRGLS
ncbi:MAG: rRNA (cytidine-2'-O-)-methyltransferase [Nitrospira sp.]